MSERLTFPTSRKEEDIALLNKINGAWCDDELTAEEEIKSPY